MLKKIDRHLETFTVACRSKRVSNHTNVILVFDIQLYNYIVYRRLRFKIS